MNPEIEVLTETPSLLGEGPLWDGLSRRLYFTDITGKKLNILDWDTLNLTVIGLPQMAGCLALTGEGKVMIAMEDGIYLREGDGSLNLLHERIGIAGPRFNDGKAGPDGRFYAGTIRREGGGQVYRLEPSGIIEPILDNVRVSNGLDWSLDLKTLYYIDTPTRRIDAFDFDGEGGTIQNRRPIFAFPEGTGSPDGMTIDEEGMLWVALWNGWKVVRVNPRTASIIGEIEMPVSRPSCCAFAGENLDEIVVTSASEDLDPAKEPLAGRLFRVRPGVRGRAPFRFGSKRL